MERIDTMTADITVENEAKLLELFPQVATEIEDEGGKIKSAVDFDALRELLGEVAEGQRERYQFTWPGKQEANSEARRPVDLTFLPNLKDSIDWDNTSNLYIEGDNLDALKLLKNTYASKIKMIYIDPPYNTGKDFIYSDNFEENSDDYNGSNGEFNDYGERLVPNPSSSGRFHSSWCSMMYPRLIIARDLLADDGIIYLSIDEKEVTNLVKICDELFGAQNHLETFHIQVRYGNKSLNEDSDFQPLMEYVLLYAKNANAFKPNKPSEPYDLSKFRFSFEELTEGKTISIGGKTVTIFRQGEWTCQKHSEGMIGLLKETWASGSIVKQSGTAAEFLSKYLIQRKEEDGLGCLYKIHNMGEDGLGYRYVTGPLKPDAIRGKFYSGVPLERLEEIQRGESRKYRPIVNAYDYSADFGNIRKEGGIPFNSGKKPTKMLNHLLYTANLTDGDIVLDFFSGSASTAHAVMEYANDQCVKLSYIMVQIPETLSENEDLFREGFRTICEIGEERIRRAGAKIREVVEEANRQLRLGEEPRPVPDTGFRVLRIDSSNFRDAKSAPDGYDQATIFDYADNLKEGRTPLDILFQVLPAFRIPYSAKIDEVEVAGKQAFVVNDGQLVACFDEDLTNGCIEEIARMEPVYAVFRDASLADDATAANLEELFKTYSPDTVRRVI